MRNIRPSLLIVIFFLISNSAFAFQMNLDPILPISNEPFRIFIELEPHEILAYINYKIKSFSNPKNVFKRGKLIHTGSVKAERTYETEDIYAFDWQPGEYFIEFKIFDPDPRIMNPKIATSVFTLEAEDEKANQDIISFMKDNKLGFQLFSQDHQPIQTAKSSQSVILAFTPSNIDKNITAFQNKIIIEFYSNQLGKVIPFIEIVPDHNQARNTNILINNKIYIQYFLVPNFSKFEDPSGYGQILIELKEGEKGKRFIKDLFYIKKRESQDLPKAPQDPLHKFKIALYYVGEILPQKDINKIIKLLKQKFKSSTKGYFDLDINFIGKDPLFNKSEKTPNNILEEVKESYKLGSSGEEYLAIITDAPLEHGASSFTSLASGKRMPFCVVPSLNKNKEYIVNVILHEFGYTLWFPAIGDAYKPKLYPLDDWDNYYVADWSNAHLRKYNFLSYVRDRNSLDNLSYSDENLDYFINFENHDPYSIIQTMPTEEDKMIIGTKAFSILGLKFIKLWIDNHPEIEPIEKHFKGDLTGLVWDIYDLPPGTYTFKAEAKQFANSYKPVPEAQSIEGVVIIE